MVLPDLESRNAMLRETIVVPVRQGHDEHREPRRLEGCIVADRKPGDDLTLGAQERRQ